MVSVRQLFELQETDTVSAEKDAALIEVRAKIADDGPIVAARKRAGSLEAQAEAQGKASNSAQLVVQLDQDKLKAVEDKLYSGGVTNSRELEALEEERQYLQTHLGEDEDKLLELMVAVEELQAGRDSVLKTLDGLETERETQLPALRQNQEDLEKELADLSEVRKQQIPNISPQNLATYESLRKTRGGKAVARLDAGKGICQACRIALPVGDLRKAKTSEEIVYCNSCRRILYIE
jgi:predicted  nucleic acid-binding Zn-ribbon protein